jgi:hypothetical protein
MLSSGCIFGVDEEHGRQGALCLLEQQVDVVGQQVHTGNPAVQVILE